MEEVFATVPHVSTEDLPERKRGKEAWSLVVWGKGETVAEGAEGKGEGEGGREEL